MKKMAFSLLVSGLLGISSLSYAMVDSFTPEASVPSTLTEKPETHTPQSCSLLDKALCMFDMKNVELIDHLIHIFSKKKGDTVVFTTENFEEILAEMRKLNVSKEELEAFKYNPDLCVEKLRPALELAAKHADITLDEQILQQFCKQAAMVYATIENAREIGQLFEQSSYRGTVTCAVVLLAAIGTYRNGLTSAVGLSAMAIVLASYLGASALGTST